MTVYKIAVFSFFDMFFDVYVFEMLIDTNLKIHFPLLYLTEFVDTSV